ncbi:TetR/AcrR family transcriptional regulator [Pseudoalteromonas sp. T1lg76]|uniref:TetR/AcrR family transcriptional regulator n=1 Tax=Pseudoalteromonas sp. T1lg76 TaxID=2077103 RepID=UPI000CF6DA1C|nr:TetR/AcrR family transcriptional regulator [Pseudoalteromonas sp. T1lg76]
MAAYTLSPQTILDRAIVLALQSSWDSFSLHELAASLNCGLGDIHRHFRSKDDLAEALFDRADQAMLEYADTEAGRRGSEQERTLNCIMSWFHYLAPYKAVVRDIMRYKLEPGHFHLQAHGVTRVSRTVQWFREAAARRQQGLAKVADEIALTSAYLSSFYFFLSDNSADNAKTRSLLAGLIKGLHTGHRFFSRPGRAT